MKCGYITEINKLYEHIGYPFKTNFKNKFFCVCFFFLCVCVQCSVKVAENPKLSEIP